MLRNAAAYVRIENEGTAFWATVRHTVLAGTFPGILDIKAC